MDDVCVNGAQLGTYVYQCIGAVSVFRRILTPRVDYRIHHDVFDGHPLDDDVVWVCDDLPRTFDTPCTKNIWKLGSGLDRGL